jgi:AcrR family transcriptional regulator
MKDIFDSHPTARRKGGRPLSFDREAALEQAMLAFWRHGYETTSISDLTQAMNVTPPSLYTAFGDKKRLFLEAVQRYAGDPEDVRRMIDDAPTALDAARSLLAGAAASFTGDSTPPGCLLASATASGSAASADVQAVVADIRRTVTGHLRDRIARDIADGRLCGDTDAEALAGLVMTVMQGLSVMARDGLTRSALLGIVDAALHGWPTQKTSESAV